MENSNKKPILIYTLNPSSCVIAECERDLYIASLLGVKNVRLCFVYDDTDNELSHFNRADEIISKLSDVSKKLGFESFLAQSSIKGKGFLPIITYVDSKGVLCGSSTLFSIEQEKHKDLLVERERVGKMLVKKSGLDLIMQLEYSNENR